MGCIKIFRWLLASILVLILFVIIIVGLPLASFSHLMTESSNLKTWLENGGVYADASDVIIDELLTKVDKEEIDFLKYTTEDELKEIARDIITEEWLKTNSEKVVDAFYAWFKGETSKPTFEITITEEQQALKDSLATIIKQYLEALPACEESSQVNLEEFDPFNAECLPSEYSTEEISTELEGKLPEDLFEKSSISSDEILKDFVSEQVSSRVQQFFSYLNKLLSVVIIVILVLTLFLFLVIPGYKNGFLYSGLAWVVASAILLFGGYYSKRNFDASYQNLMSKIPQEQAEIAVEIFKEPIKLGYFSVLSEVSKYGIIFVVLGMILAFGGLILKLSKRKYFVREEGLEAEEGEQIEAIEEAANVGGAKGITRKAKKRKEATSQPTQPATTLPSPTAGASPVSPLSSTEGRAQEPPSPKAT